MKIGVLCATALLLLKGVFAQNVPIGSWHSHLPYNGTYVLADAGDKIYCGNEISVFSYSPEDNSFDRLSTAAGFSEVGIRDLQYDIPSKTLVITYTNSNVDFVFEQDIYNYPFIKESAINGDKNVYHASFSGDTIILSCGFGVVLFDIEKRESPATIFFTDADAANMKVNATTTLNEFIYAASTGGLYAISTSDVNMQDFSHWDLKSGSDGLPSGEVKQVANFNHTLYAQVADTIYQYDGTSWMPWLYEENWHTNSISVDEQAMVVTQVFGINSPADSSRIITLLADGTITDLTNDVDLLFPSEATLGDDGELWIADLYRGLLAYDGAQFKSYLPNGPGTSDVTDMKSAGNVLYVAPGEINASWNYQYNHAGFFAYDYGFWNTLNQYGFGILDSVYDFITVDVDKKNNVVYMGSFGGGLVAYDRSTGVMQLYKQGYLENAVGDPGSYRVGGLAVDSSSNLWISNFGSIDPIAVRKADGTWAHFNPGLTADVFNQLGQIAIDEFNTKWIQLPRGNGILVFNEQGTIDDQSDDLIKVLGAGAGNGNLHTNYINCIAVDKQSEIWVGTSEGITIFYNPSEVYTGTTAGDATQPLVNLGGYYEQLLRNDIVNTIAVDGANRKWVGTNSGAFLISADGTEQLLYFNSDNSPLISNTVLNIEIDGTTGDVYFGTDKGIISYRYTATEGVGEITSVKAFPNPVREDYTGSIAISGLTADAEVRITDMAGRTIYQTIALGGQAVWDGNGYDGKRAATGVYMVYASNEDGSETAVSKILVISSK